MTPSESTGRPAEDGAAMSAFNSYHMYILASKRNGTLYVGVTSELENRVCQHKHNLADGFTQRYSIHRLVYYEGYADIYAAIQREKRIKKWNRAWKIRLIEKHNPTWKDLYSEDGTILPLPKE
jgi:putative endonuclease